MQPTPGATSPVRAAGAVLWRITPAAALEIALVHRPKYDDWSLPKGKLDDGEHILAAAVREVEEETGVPARLGRPLPTQHYLVDGRPKEVRYWAACARAGSPPAFVPNREVDGFRWLPIGDADRQLTQARDSGVIAAFAAAPIVTTPLLLVRHASAVIRSGWTGEDPVRPLDETGVAQSEALAPLMSAYGIQHLLVSDTRRCADTFRPYADQRGLTLDDEPLFSEEGFHHRRDNSMERAVRLLTVDRPTAVCSHRAVLPDLVVLLCRRSGIAPPAGGLQAGAFWVLHLAEGRVVAVEEHAPDTVGSD